IDLNQADVYVNVVGGLKLGEPAADLAVTSALISSHKQIQIHPSMIFAGELGLTGEIRGVSFVADRLKEAEKLGFKYFVLPESNRKHLKGTTHKMQLLFVKSISDLANSLNNFAENRTTKKTTRHYEDEVFS
ncbi:MAG: hypothetical protein KDD40_11345, partial [Bdellovibrionales bacterium]|nr:hypothetical protein [Bdellovibrionales bacterium]